MNTKKSKTKTRLRFIAFLLCCAALGYFLGRMGVIKSGGASKISAGFILLFLIPSFFVAIAIHEAGHAVAGVWMKFDFRMYVVGPFMWTKETSGWRFKWNKNVNTFGGFVICLPNNDENLIRRFSIYAAGGPFASLIFALVTFAICFVMWITPHSVPAGSGYKAVITLLALLTALSTLIFLVTAMPMQSGGFSSDGSRILHLLKGGRRARFELLILKLIAKSSSGTRPAAYNTEELMEALTIATELNAPFGTYIHGFLYHSQFDRGNLELAENHLSDYINVADKIPEGIRNAVWLDAAFFYAFTRRDSEKANHFWAKFKPSAIISKAQILATEAAMASMNNQHDMAVKKGDEAIMQLDNMMDKGSAIMLRDKIAELKNRL